MKFNCPICGKPADSETDRNFPFCSERCRLIDLGNWATEKYKVAVPLMDESEISELPRERPRQGEPSAGKEDAKSREPNSSHHSE